MPDYKHLVSHIQDLEVDLKKLQSELAVARSEAKAAQTLVHKLRQQAKTSQTLSLGLFSMIDPKQIYELVCESLVSQIGWSGACVLTVKGKRVIIKGSFGMSQSALRHISDYLPNNPLFLEAVLHQIAISTFPSTLFQRNGSDALRSDRLEMEKIALTLRSVFSMDEVVAMPILFSDRLYGYLVVGACQDSPLTQAQMEDLDFLATVAAHVGHAVEYSHNFSSLEEQNRELRHLDEVKDSFISITSHQLRTPLSIVKWILSILQTNAEIAKYPEPKKLIDQAYESNERLIHVVNDLLNISRMTDGKLPYSPQPTELKQILDDIKMRATASCQNKGLTFTMTLPDTSFVLNLDQIIFREAIQDLVDNAIDYNRENGYVKVEVSDDANNVYIKVINSGIGIKDEELNKLFEQFYRSPDAQRIQPSGNGLGLFLSRAIIRQHGGDISIESIYGQETTFTVRLPKENP
jgi:adenylate cyclase